MHTQPIGQLILHIFQIISGNPRKIHSRHFQELVCSIHKLLEAISAESLLVWFLALVMVHKEQDIILCSVLESEIYGEILLYLISLLDIDWNTVSVASGVFTYSTHVWFLSPPKPAIEPCFQWMVRLSFFSLNSSVSPFREPISKKQDGDTFNNKTKIRNCSKYM